MNRLHYAIYDRDSDSYNNYICTAFVRIPADIRYDRKPEQLSKHYIMEDV